MALRRALYLVVFLAPLLGFGIHSAQAQSADASMQAREAKARELFTLMHMEATYTQLTQQVMQQSEQQARQLFPQNAWSDSQKQEYASFMARIEALVADTISWQVLEPEFERIYAENLTETDLDGVISFYRSPAGQSFISKQPQLLHAGSALSTQRMETVMPQLQGMMQDEMKKMAGESAPQAVPETKN